MASANETVDEGNARLIPQFNAMLQTICGTSVTGSQNACQHDHSQMATAFVKLAQGSAFCWLATMEAELSQDGLGKMGVAMLEEVGANARDVSAR